MARIEIDTVHAVLQLRCLAGEKDARAAAAYELHDAGHPLQAEVDERAYELFGILDEWVADNPRLGFNPANTTLVIDHASFTVSDETTGPFDNGCGARIKARRLSLGLTQTRLGNAVGAALGLLGAGIWRQLKPARYAGITLLSVALLKLFLHDLARLEALYRIGALFGVAVIAILASFAYQRFLPSNEKTPPPLP